MGHFSLGGAVRLTRSWERRKSRKAQWTSCSYSVLISGAYVHTYIWSENILCIWLSTHPSLLAWVVQIPPVKIYSIKNKVLWRTYGHRVWKPMQEPVLSFLSFSPEPLYISTLSRSRTKSGSEKLLTDKENSSGRLAPKMMRGKMAADYRGKDVRRSTPISQNWKIFLIYSVVMIGKVK